MNCPLCKAELEPGAAKGQLVCPACGKALPLPASTDSPDTERVAAQASTVVDPEQNSGDPASGPAPAERTSPLPESTDTGVAFDPATGAEFGKYRIIRRIGYGGMGEVFEAEQERPARRVALKILPSGRLASPNSRERFLREATAVALLDHPYIVPIYDSGEADDGTLYYTMELVKGAPLDTFASNAELRRESVLRLFIRVCEGVQAAHQRGVIHRDLKPANIFVDADGFPRILDFGLAKIVAENLDGATQLTRDGHVMGTPAFMAPEQLKGEAAEVDTRSDLYALGVILYRLIVGEYPYRAARAPVEMLRQVTMGPPLRPRAVDRTIPIDLAAILLKAIAVEKDRRYQSALEFARDLERFLADEPVEAQLPTTMYKLTKLIVRNRFACAISATFTVILVAVLTVSFLRLSAARHRAEEQRDRAFSAEVSATSAGKAEARHRRIAEERAQQLTERSSELAGRIDDAYWEAQRRFAHIGDPIARLTMAVTAREWASDHKIESSRPWTDVARDALERSPKLAYSTPLGGVTWRVAFSADGALFACSMGHPLLSSHDTIAVWETDSGRCRFRSGGDGQRRTARPRACRNPRLGVQSRWGDPGLGPWQRRPEALGLA